MVDQTPRRASSPADRAAPDPAETFREAEPETDVPAGSEAVAVREADAVADADAALAPEPELDAQNDAELAGPDGA